MCFELLLALFSSGEQEHKRTSVFEDVPFQDFNNAWDSNNDHNWEADGDTRWDSHGEGFPGEEQ